MFVWVCVLILLFALTIFFATYALPRFYLKLNYAMDKSNDRCINRVYEKNGQSLLFEPEEKWRKYINQYIIAERKEKKEIVCKVDKELSYIEFNVVVFDAFNKVTQVIKVCESLDGRGYTKAIELPPETSYVAINVLRADNKTFEEDKELKVSKSKMLGFLLVNAMVVFMEVIGYKICLANIFGGLFRQSILVNFKNVAISLIIAVVLIVINTLVAIIDVKSREKKLMVKVEENA